MKKRLVFLLIAALVILNISTNCGYGRLAKATKNRVVVDDNEVDSIRIKKTGNKKWKRLDEGQEYSFENACKGLAGTMPHRFSADYEIRVFLKAKKRRDFSVNENKLREGRLYYYFHGISADFFDKLYADAK
jgi:hypothetical protein